MINGQRTLAYYIGRLSSIMDLNMISSYVFIRLLHPGVDQCSTFYVNFSPIFV
jgi:hypothetical protein